MKNKIIIIYLIVFLILIYFFNLVIIYSAFPVNDSPEIITAFNTLGITHPPGYPLLVLIGKIFLLLSLGDVAINSNLLSLILSVLNLFLLFFVIKIFINDYKIIFFIIFINAFSYGFLKEAIQAKGSVYMLNLMFLSIIIILLNKNFIEFEKKTLFLLIYIYSLSLANHWQTMIFFFPVIIYSFILNLKKIKIIDYFIISFLITTGISPYLFLLIRAKSNPVLNWGDPENLNELLKHIFRINYIGEFENLNAGVLIYQIKEFIDVFIKSYSFLILFIIWSIFLFIKQKDKLSFIILFIFFINILSIIFFFRRRQDSSCYYLPSIYLSAVFLSIAIKKIFFIKSKIIKVTFLFFIVILGIINSYKNYGILDGSRNFLSYDYINNIFKTMKDNSIYFTFSDLDIMPIFYIKNLKKKYENKKVIYSNFLNFNWGIEKFKNDFSDFKEDLFLKKSGKNVKNIIKFYENRENIYMGFNLETLQKLDIKFRQEGIITVAGRLLNKQPELNYFELYSLRGLFNKNYQDAKDSFILISNYAGNMLNFGNEFLKIGNVKMALKLYEKAVKLPYNKSKKGFYKNLFIVYNIVKDFKKAEYYYNLYKNSR